MFIFMSLKCCEKHAILANKKTYYFSQFFKPNFPIFDFSRMAAMALLSETLFFVCHQYMTCLLCEKCCSHFSNLCQRRLIHDMNVAYVGV